MNISISEILLVLIVALVVIKPEQLPGLALKLGRWTQQIRKSMAKLQQELDGTVNHLSREARSLTEKIEVNHDRGKQ